MWDPGIPESQQPYHAALDRSAEEGVEIVRRAIQAVEAVAIQAVRSLVEGLRGSGHELSGIGLVASSNTDPDRLGNAHIRAHASEGRLFRRVLEAAAGVLEVPCLVLIEREAFTKAEAALSRPAGELKRIVTELGHSIGRPWGAEEKMASLAAWMMLAR